MNPLPIGRHTLGRGHPVYLAWEIGGTMRSLESALRLLAVAADSGAQAIKVQMLDANRLVAEDRPFAYRTAAGETSRSLRELLAQRSLPRGAWLDFGAAAHDAGLDLIATVDYADTLETALLAGACALKVMSADVNYLDWVAEVAKAGVPLMLDSGNATLGEIEQAVDAALPHNDKIILHHVGSGYPSRAESVNLRMIPMLQQVFEDIPIAYSDHGEGPDLCIAATAMGVAMIEKNLTENRQADGPEHLMATDLSEARAFVETIRRVEAALGRSRRVVSETERRVKAVARRSAFTKRAILFGDEIGPEDVEWRRPGDGIEPGEARYLLGRRAARNLPAGQKILFGDVE